METIYMCDTNTSWVGLLPPLSSGWLFFSPLTGIGERGQLSMLEVKLKWLEVKRENDSTLHRSWDCVQSQNTDISRAATSPDLPALANWLQVYFFIVLNYLSFLIAHSALPVSILKQRPSQLTELTSVNSIIQRWLLVSSAEGWIQKPQSFTFNARFPFPHFSAPSLVTASSFTSNYLLYFKVIIQLITAFLINQKIETMFRSCSVFGLFGTLDLWSHVSFDKHACASRPSTLCMYNILYPSKEII